MEKNDIAIVGMSVFCPGANNIHDFWKNISGGVDSITEAPDHIIDHEYFKPPDGSIDRFYCKRGGFTNPISIDPLRYGILPVAAEGMDPEHLVMLGGVEQALFDAEVFQKDISLKKGCVILGKGNFAGLIALRSAEIIRNAHFLSGLIRNVLPDIPEEEIQKIKKEYQTMQGRYQADTAIGTMPNLVASMVANKFDIQGPAYTVDAACASGLLAVDHAIGLLNSGQCDIAIAGGMHTIQSPMFWSAFNMMGAMSRKEVIAPFSEEADGLLIGQGGGMMILKKLEKAVEDKDRIYAVIKSTAVCSDGGGSHVMVTSVDGQKRVLEMAWKKSGLDPENIGYIEAHGTGTPVGDKTEIATLTEFFGDKSRSRAYVGSVKSNIGHTMPAAGMIGLIKTALSLYYRKIPPTLHCEKPLKAMFDSRFRPPQELIDWDESKYPLVAGVNAFGFGGINSHAVLTAYKGNEEDTAQFKSQEPAIIIAAKTKEELVGKLENNINTVSEGDYRLVIFNPDERKLQIAKTIIEKGDTWTEKQDIWFSCDPLLKKDAKVAFVFPGFFDMNLEFETDTLSESFNLPKVNYDKIDTAYNEKDEILQRRKEQEAQGTKLFYNSWVNDYALKKVGIVPDVYAGFSIGEWFAAMSSGIVSEADIQKIIQALEIENKEVENIFYISILAGYDKVQPLTENIENLYLSVDCCPNNILMCGDESAKGKLETILKTNNLPYYIMPFKSGFHTPLLKDYVDTVYDACKDIEVNKDHIPVWSANHLQPYPDNKEGLTQLIVDNVVKPLYFHGLIKKLYEEENVRIFIQIGMGGTEVFIRDILAGKEACAISSALPNKSGIEQIRRVLALFFIQGKALEYNFLHVLGLSVENQILKSSYTLPQGAPVIKEFPALKEAIQKYYSLGSLSLPSFSGKTSHPVLDSMNVNLQEINETFREVISVQQDITQIFDRTGYFNQDFQVEAGDIKREPVNKVQKELSDFEEKIYLKLEDHEYLLDHAIIRQPKNWKYKEDLNPVIPMTMTLELFAEIAHRYVPERKIVKIGPATIVKWMSVEKPFEQTITGKWKDKDTVVMEMKGYANIEVTFADKFPAEPEEYKGSIDIGNEIMPPITIEEVYNRYTFHGPAYHATTEIKKIAERGILGISRKKRGKGSLLDNFGQALGLFLHLTEKENMISFPIKVKEIRFYQDMYDQEGEFEQTTVIKSLSPNFEIGDVILKREGKVWAVAKTWIGQRFPFDVNIWNVILKPGIYQLSQKINSEVYGYDNSYKGKERWMFLCARYLNYPEKQQFELLPDQEKDKFLANRIVLKDAVNAFIRKEGEDYRFPVEIFVEYDSNGKPSVYGSDELDNVEVSLAHKGQEVVAIASDKPVGIDIEFIKERADDFIKYTYTQKELEFIKDKDQAEWTTRLWVAKEAYSKMTGEGLKGNPKQYEAEKIKGESIFIRNMEIQTVKYKNEYIVGWIKSE